MEKTIIKAGGGLVLNDKGELLMIYRRGKWDLPKGKLDEGETIEECAVREVMEETGAGNIERGELIIVGRHEYFDRFLEEEVIKETYWYLMKARGEQNVIPQTEEDITEIKWVIGKELQVCLEDTYPNILDVVEKAGLI